MKKLSHINDKGEANMVDINNKKKNLKERQPQQEL